uniref:5-hydroxytryptamine (serotonin) receptor 3A n=1 Tax=Mastacembelus armatus TaxID=205130 RepID=A0A3Q3RI78_9TELE
RQLSRSWVPELKLCVEVSLTISSRYCSTSHTSSGSFPRQRGDIPFVDKYCSSKIYLQILCLFLSYSMEKNTAPFAPYCYLFTDGLILDTLPAKVVSSCKLDIYKFPFDIQNCSLTFTSYLHHGNSSAENVLTNSKYSMTTMGEWELVGITLKKDQLQDTDVKRRYITYVVNLLIPSCFLITVDLFSFLLPPKTVDRSAFKMTLILGYTVFLLLMNDLLPVTGNSMPLINVFLSLCLALMVASLLETVIVTNLLCGSADYAPVPRWIRVFVLHILGQLVWLPPKPKDLQNTIIQTPGPLDEDKTLEELQNIGRNLKLFRIHVEQQLGENQSTREWVQVGLVIDRLLFGLYVVFISVSFITIIIVWAQSYNTF